uniref:Uncharacterized protein n=1 Tax=Streptomyces avermitilis TaxID=33903 RepID=A0A499UZG8_STRAX|nr:hypothetical protein SAVMC3_00130 [Streptomyces avermitilis]
MTGATIITVAPGPGMPLRAVPYGRTREAVLTVTATSGLLVAERTSGRGVDAAALAALAADPVRRTGEGNAAPDAAT